MKAKAGVSDGREQSRSAMDVGIYKATTKAKGLKSPDQPEGDRSDSVICKVGDTNPNQDQPRLMKAKA